MLAAKRSSAAASFSTSLLKVPVISIAPEKAAEHFGWFAHFAGVDMPASSEWTRKTLGWNPTGPGLIEDLTNMKYE